MTSPLAGIVSPDEIVRYFLERKGRSYSLKEVAEMTGIRLRTLEDACRDDKVEHTQLGRHRVMTMEQIELMLATHKRGVTEAPIEVDDLQLAIEQTKRTARRGTKAGA
jgi:hypothetical protein